jgi:hypothetical protein
VDFPPVYFSVDSASLPGAHFPVMRWRLAIASGLILAAAALCLFVVLPREPSFQGRSLSAWLAALDDGEGGRAIQWSPEPLKKLTQEQVEASQAVRQMGTNALPELFERLQTREGTLRSKKESVRDWLMREGFMRRSYAYESHTPAAEVRHRAALGIIALEPSAKPQVSKLVPLFNDAEFSKEAALVLASIAPAGLLPLQAEINKAPSWQSTCAVWALAHFRTNSDAIIPGILADLTNSDVGIRCRSAWTLTRIQIDPEVAVQALTNAAGQQDLRNLCLRALANYGTRAQSAVPFLVDQLRFHHILELAFFGARLLELG